MFQLSDSINFIKFVGMKFKKINLLFDLIKNLKILIFEKIDFKDFKKIKLTEFPSDLYLTISECGYVSLKGVEKFEGALNLDEDFKSKYEGLKTFKKFKGQKNWI